jgi:hypothetical protein
MCARVDNQRSHGVVTTSVRIDVVQSLRHQRRDLHKSIYLVPLKTSGLILLSAKAITSKIELAPCFCVTILLIISTIMDRKDKEKKELRGTTM